jgi:LysM repeat protein
MGLFDFASNLGKKIFGSDEDPSEKIQAHIEKDNPGIEGLKVEVVDGEAKISGKTEDRSAFEKAVLMAGNIFGIKKVNAEALSAPAEEGKVFYHVVESGDTLWALASKHLGDGNRHPEIFEANKEVIKDPDLIYSGQKIRIPLDD